jgi:undecaprenyl-diphosphatase
LLYLKGAYINIVHKKSSFEGRMFFYLVMACIPGALVGFLLEGSLEDLFRSNYILIAITLAVMGIIIYLGDKYADIKYKNQTKFEDLNFIKTFLIGISQALAIIPGFSRSGTTIVTARLLGVSKEAAAKFTFLLSTPVIFGATIFKFKELVLNFNLQILVGIITATIVGLITIKFLLEYVKTKSFAIFAYYRFIIAGIIIIKVLMG